MPVKPVHEEMRNVSVDSRDSNRAKIYTTRPTMDGEAELGPILEKLYERFYNRTDFIDPASLHDIGGGGDGLVDGLDINDNLFWKYDGEFDEKRFYRERAREKDDSLILDVLFNNSNDTFVDEIMGAMGDVIDIDFQLTPPFIDIDFDPLEGLFGGLFGMLKEAVLGTVREVDAVLVSRKANVNMVGAAMEAKEAYDNDIPVAVYDHDSQQNGTIPEMLDAHADYVTDNPYWAASWLIDEAERRKEREENGEEAVQEVTVDV